MIYHHFSNMEKLHVLPSTDKHHSLKRIINIAILSCDLIRPNITMCEYMECQLYRDF